MNNTILSPNVLADFSRLRKILFTFHTLKAQYEKRPKKVTRSGITDTDFLKEKDGIAVQ